MPHYEHMHAATALRQRLLQEESVPALVVAAPEPPTLDPFPHPPPLEHPVPPEEPVQTILGVPVTPAPPPEENAPPAI